MFYSKISFDFKSKNDVFIYIVDVNMNIIQIRNVTHKTIIISRYAKLKRVMNYKKKLLFNVIERRALNNQIKKTNF